MRTIPELNAEIQDLREYHRNLAHADGGSGYRLDLARRLSLLATRIPAAEKAVQIAERTGTPHATAMARRAVIAAWRVTGTLVE